MKLNNIEDYILVRIALSKLPQETLSNFELIRSYEELCPYDEVIQCVRQCSKKSIKFDKNKSPSYSIPAINHKPAKSFHISKKIFLLKPNSNCLFYARENHLLKDYQSFINSSFESKFNEG